MKIDLPDQEWNYINAMLRKRPWEEVFMILAHIGMQIEQQQQFRPHPTGDGHVPAQPETG